MMKLFYYNTNFDNSFFRFQISYSVNRIPFSSWNTKKTSSPLALIVPVCKTRWKTKSELRNTKSEKLKNKLSKVGKDIACSITFCNKKVNTKPSCSHPTDPPTRFRPKACCQTFKSIFIYLYKYFYANNTNVSGYVPLTLYFNSKNGKFFVINLLIYLDLF